MGYYGTASVLTSEPNWEALDKLPELKNLRGYRHKAESLWLIEVGFRAENKPDWAFTSPPNCNPVIAADKASASILEAREAIKQVIHCTQDVFESISTEYLDIAIRLACALNQRVFTFVADDDLIDHACGVTPNGIDLFVSKSASCLYRFDRTGHCVKLFPFEEEPEETEHLTDCQARLQKDSPLAKVEIVDFEDQYAQFYYCGYTFWPEDGGDPEAMLKIGTWEPFQNLQDDYEVVYERIQQTAHSPRASAPPQQAPKTGHTKEKPWWKFW